MFGTISFFFNADIGVGQGFALLPISSMLYIALIFHILEIKTKNLSIANLFCSYSIISSLFKQFRLIIEYNKFEVFHFSRLTKSFNPFSLDLRSLGDTILRQKDT